MSHWDIHQFRQIQQIYHCQERDLGLTEALKEPTWGLEVQQGFILSTGAGMAPFRLQDGRVGSYVWKMNKIKVESQGKKMDKKQP